MEAVVEDHLVVFHCELQAGVGWLGLLLSVVVVKGWRKDKVFYVLSVVNAHF